MAKVSLTVAGGIIGSFVGAPHLGMMIGGALGGYIERKNADPIRQEGPRLDDLKVQVSSYGSPIYRVWGTMRIAGNIIWAGNKIQSSTTETSGGGKDGPEVATTAYHYHSSFAIAICVGPVDRLLRIWADGKLIYSVIPSNDSIIGISGLNFTFYEGNETQVADPIIEAVIGAGDVPGFRGMCYVVFESFPLALFGNRIPNFSFDVTTNASEDDVPFTLLNDFIDPADWPEDRIVFFPDGVNFIVEQLQHWAKFNTTNNALIKLADYSAFGDYIPAKFGGSPYETVNFDIDEGNYIYTLAGSSGTHYLTKLDGITLAMVEQAASAMGEAVNYMRVFRNPTYPFIISFKTDTDNAAIYIHSRTGLTGTYIDAFIPYSEHGGDAVFAWHSMDLDDDNGIIWAVSSVTYFTAVTYFTIHKIQLNTDGAIATHEFRKALYGSDNIATEIIYDPTSDQIAIGSTGHNWMKFYDAGSFSPPVADVGDTLTPILLSHMSIQLDAGRMKSAFRQGVKNGYLYIHTTSGGDFVNRVDVVAYAATRTWELIDSTVAFSGGACYDPLTHSMVVGVDISGAPRIIKMNLDRSDSTQVLLSDIVDDICEISGLDPNTEIDTTDLTTLVHGFVANEGMRARAALQVLMEGYFFSAVESDGILKFINKGGSVVDAILAADLAAYTAESQRPQQLVTIRTEELSMPKELNLMYVDYVSDYQTNVQRAQRQLAKSVDTLTVRLPIALDSDGAKQIAAKMFQALWTERIGHTIVVSRKYMHLDPGDVITVTEGGNVHTVRIEAMQYGPGTITMELVNEDAGSYVSAEEGFTLPPPDEIIVEYPGPSLLVVVDIPALGYSIVPGVFIAVQGYTEYWKGAQVLRSPPQGAV